MSSFLKNREIGLWPYPIGSNHDQSYLTHSIFRYFGKLPPVLTGQLIDEYAYEQVDSPVVIDPMCGSGTTLVEAQKRGLRSVGVDANGIALLASEVKTTPIQRSKVRDCIADFRRRFSDYLDLEAKKGWADPSREDGQLEAWQQYIPNFRNRDKWFREHAQTSLARSRKWIDKHNNDEPIYRFLLLCWLGIIRKVSNASVRPGRIFHDHDKGAQPVFTELLKRLNKTLGAFEDIPEDHFYPLPELVKADARELDLTDQERGDFGILHPPYFALYRYSSDVLRFELEWSQYDRKDIRGREIEEGFKTTDPSLMYDYVDDLMESIESTMQNMNPGSTLCLVVGNSTLSNEQLPVLETILERLSATQHDVRNVIERPINYSQSDYHKSADSSINSDSDYIVLLDKSL
ncbi:site-specific DNA-methyltransferase [Salinibacter ruber]|uniref:site-specific DNA-methyltransferase n=1 Tax=Salinibacter ruber TaxID=146919 RepID=UPI002072DA6D|nr:site-specific DNA-methyltransferase [Salinibacter ruber]